MKFAEIMIAAEIPSASEAIWVSDCRARTRARSHTPCHCLLCLYYDSSDSGRHWRVIAYGAALSQFRG